ncbi:MAG TPA: hypothetical protein VF808_13440 [Ktedonobacterales bacterium]
MVTGDPSIPAQAAHRRPRIWPWAAGSILIPLVIIAGALAGSRYAARARLAAEVTPAQALPPLRVLSVIQPLTPIGQWALMPNAVRPVALTLTYAASSACLPGATCAAPIPGQLTLYDAASAAPLASQSLAVTGLGQTDLRQCELATDTTSSIAYLVCSGLVERIALDTGRTSMAFAYPYNFTGGHAELGVADHTLFISLGQTLSAYNLESNQLTASQTLGGQLSAPYLDAERGRVFVVVNGGSDQPRLAAFTTRGLTPLGNEALPAGWRAGPRDHSTDRLYLFSKDGAVGAVELGASVLELTPPYPAASVTTYGPLRGARALGWDPINQAVVALFSDHLTAFDTESLQPYGSLPVSGVWDPQRPLAVDSYHGVLYAPDTSSAIAAISLGHPNSRIALEVPTAIMLARAGLGALLPDTNQSPPFLDYTTFPLTMTALARNFAIHYSDLGWRGPFAGHAAVASVKAGKQPGDYVITFAVDWNQLFVHRHAWTVELLPDGRVRMLTDTGDAIP